MNYTSLAEATEKDDGEGYLTYVCTCRNKTQLNINWLQIRRLRVA